MKEFYTLILILLCCFKAQAQIQRNFWGVRLGETSKEELLAHLKANNRRFSVNLSMNSVDCAQDIPHLGIIWYGVSYTLHKDTVVKITFARPKSVNYGELEIKEDYSYLLRTFLTLYGGLREINQSFYVVDHSTATEVFMDTNRELPVLRLHYYDLNTKKHRFKFGNMW